MRQTALLGIFVVAIATVDCAAPDPRNGAPAPAPAVAAASMALQDCSGAGTRCTAADQCCSNRCDISDPSTGVGVCRSLDVLEGPLVELPQSVKTSDLRLTPPAVVDVQAARGPSGGSLVFVRFAADARLGRTVALSAAATGDTVLHDDGTGGDERAGDGVYTGTVPLDFTALSDANQARLTALRRLGRTTVPVFQGREQIRDQAIDFGLHVGRVSFIPFPMPWLVDQHRSVAITAVNVLEDPARTFNQCTHVGTPLGKWTFGYFMTQMANQAVSGVNPSDFVLDWLSRWLTNQPVGITSFAAARPSVSAVIAAWPKLPDGRLDLAQAPFKLTAIMNRIDLAGNPSYGAVGGAETRFIFRLVDQTTCSLKDFEMIFEYGVPRHNCFAMKLWAQQWLDLGSLPLGSPAYNAALEAITEQVVAANAEPTKPNGSAINQVRSNELQFGPPTELREFKLVPASPPAALLREATVKQTPDRVFNGATGGARAADLAEWININLSAVMAGTYTVPPADPFPPGGDFIAAAIVNNIDFWNAPGIQNNTARFQLSLNTCNGCHGDETNTQLVMVADNGFGLPPSVTPFITGETVGDPVDSSQHTFNELLHRAGKLQAFADAFCGPPAPPPGPAFPLPPINAMPLLAAH